MSEYKEDIIRLRKEGKSYKEIEEVLGCSRGTVSYHCQKEGLTDVGLTTNKELSEEKKAKVRQYYKDHTKKETKNKFNVSGATVIRYGEEKGRKKLTEEQRRENSKLRNRRLREKKKKKAVKFLGGECEKCGYDGCINAFDFHHKNSDEKNSRISALISRCRKWEVIKEELEKCKLLCANCHREYHFKNYE